MKLCINGTILLRHPQVFCMLAESLITNAHEVYLFTLVTEKTGNALFRQIQNLFCAYTVSSFVVADSGVADADLALTYAIENDINVWIDADEEICKHLKKNGFMSLSLQ